MSVRDTAGCVVYHNALFGILIVQIIRGANKHQFGLRMVHLKFVTRAQQEQAPPNSLSEVEDPSKLSRQY